MSVHRFETLPAVPRILHNPLVSHVGISSFVGYARGRELANMSSSQVTLGPDSLRRRFCWCGSVISPMSNASAGLLPMAPQQQYGMQQASQWQSQSATVPLGSTQMQNSKFDPLRSDPFAL